MATLNSDDLSLLRLYLQSNHNNHKAKINITNDENHLLVPLEIFKPLRTSEFENLLIKLEDNILYVIFCLIYGQESKVAILDINNMAWKLIYKFSASDVFDITSALKPNEFFIAERYYQFYKPTITACKKIVIKSINKIQETDLRLKETLEKDKKYTNDFLSFDRDKKVLWLIENGIPAVWI